MIFVGIDVAKNKHDCFITNTDGEVYLILSPSPTISMDLMTSIEKYHPLLKI